MIVNTYLIVTRYLSSRTSNRRSYVTLDCERRGANKPRTKPKVDNEEEEVQVKRRGKQMEMCESWQLFVYDERHNHAIGVYNHGHAQATKLTEQLLQTKQFRKSRVPPQEQVRLHHRHCRHYHHHHPQVEPHRLHRRYGGN
ncbi:hypothetical protein M9H77_23923 [Catharanthus roseus]|uniref:Uncharacterized protein n=1 Tax=Catharanthus roseus TaxID=4058 RepID=A0ACC0AUN8_CATRO|nr:hypothetical protein M9H77_23923 [Catharanthus roseus]